MRISKLCIVLLLLFVRTVFANPDSPVTVYRASENTALAREILGEQFDRLQGILPFSIILCPTKPIVALVTVTETIPISHASHGHQGGGPRFVSIQEAGGLFRTGLEMYGPEPFMVFQWVFLFRGQITEAVVQSALRQLSRLANLIPYAVSVDFALFIDGSTYGPDSTGNGEQLRSRGKDIGEVLSPISAMSDEAAKEYLKEVLQTTKRQWKRYAANRLLRAKNMRTEAASLGLAQQ